MRDKKEQSTHWLKMIKSQKITLVGIKSDLARLPRFKNHCYVCHAKKSKRGMTFHHLYYLKNERTNKDFSTPLEYYEYVGPLIRNNPARFLYVCNVHHQAISRLFRWKGINRNRLIKAVRMTR